MIDEKIDEAIEILEDGLEHADMPEWEIMKKALTLLESAKAEQPPAGEFTRIIKAMFDGCYISVTDKSCLTKDGLQIINEACDRLDAQQKEIDRLETLSDAYEEKTERLDAEIDRLTAKLDAQQKEIECYRLRSLSAEKGWENAQQEIECYRLRSLSAEKGWIQVTNERVEKIRELTAGNAKLKQDIEHLHGQGGLLFERIAELEKVVRKAASALRDIHRLDINAGTCPEAIGSGECDVCQYIDEFEQALQPKEGEKP